MSAVRSSSTGAVLSALLVGVACSGPDDPPSDGGGGDDGAVAVDAPAVADGATPTDGSAPDLDASALDGGLSDRDGSMIPTAAACRFRIGGEPAIHEAATSFIVSGDTVSAMCNSADRSLRLSIVASAML